MPPFRALVTTIVAASVLCLGACEPTKKPDTDGPTPPPTTDPPATDRKPVVPADHPLHARLEGSGPDACSADSGCFMGGCSSEVCSAEEGVITTCEVVDRPGWPSDAACGCVSGSCQWWSASGGTLGGGGGGTPAGDCGGETCEAPKECISYYGIAGPSGPEFKSCEIRCKPGKGGCPDGMQCITIADGPGEVCRPVEASP